MDIAKEWNLADWNEASKQIRSSWSLSSRGSIWDDEFVSEKDEAKDITH